jgi:enoyl-CoA hydratase/carnithine racemase
VSTQRVGEFRDVEAEKHPQPHIGRITFNRPDKRNAVHAHMAADTTLAMDGLEWDDAIKTIVFKGAGTSFSASAFRSREERAGV